MGRNSKQKDPCIEFKEFHKIGYEKSKSLVLLTSNWNLVFPSIMNINIELAISVIF